MPVVDASKFHILNFLFFDIPEAYSELSGSSKMEVVAKIVNG